MKTRDAGFTLVELLVVVVLGAVILGAVVRTLTVQQQTLTYQSAVIDTQEATRTALEVLAGELREISSTGADLEMAAPESLTVRTMRKMGFVCFVDAGGLILDVWALGTSFATGDQILVWDRGGDPDDPADDTWLPLTVVSVDNAGYNLAGCSDWAETNLRGSEIGSYPRQRLVTAGGLSGTIIRGAPVRSHESITYGIHHLDGQWKLARHGLAEPPVGLIGPLAPPADSGLHITYYDTAGVEVSPASLPGSLDQIGSFHVAVKGFTVGGLAAPGGNDVEDNLGITIFLRNNDPSGF